jgi:cobyrinic acid a,c-diamide synthase
MYIYQLAENHSMMEEIKKAAEAGMPLYAECGGLMYLTRAIVDFTGEEFPLVGLVPARCIMEKRLVGMGYVETEVQRDNVLAEPGVNSEGMSFIIHG